MIASTTTTAAPVAPPHDTARACVLGPPPTPARRGGRLVAGARRAATALLLAPALGFAQPVATAVPPGAFTAPVKNVADTLHGVTVNDPYRYLENLADPTTRRFLDSQGEATAKVLAALPGRDAMVARLAELAAASGDSVRDLRRMPGGRIYYLKRKKGESQYKLMLRTLGAGEERMLLSPEARSERSGVPHAIDFYAPSWDGRHLAYGISAGGSEDSTLHVIEIGSGKPAMPPAPRAGNGLVAWSPDDRFIVYNQLQPHVRGAAETEKFLDSTVIARRVGVGLTGLDAKPRVIFGRKATPELGLERLDVGGVTFDPASRFMVARTTDTTVPEGRLYVAPVAALAAGAPVPWQAISRFDDKITAIELRRDRLYLRTHEGAPRGRIIALDLGKTTKLADAVEVVPEPKSGVLTGFGASRDALFYQVRDGFNTRVLRVDGDAQPPSTGVDIAPQLAGSTYLIEDPSHGESDVVISTGAWTEPARVLRGGAGGSGDFTDTGLRDGRMPAGAPELEAREVLVPSHDGALVPLAVIHRKGLALNGANPTILDGYGAYGITNEARFNPLSIAWFERGGVLAIANVRGSGAFGEAWHRAGFKTTKPNTWKDGIACAEWLVREGYASPKTLGVQGGSAGGIFAGRAATSAPQLFAAAVWSVGLLDAVRAEGTSNGITNISEFGTVAKADEFAALLEMSTYHQIKDGVAYPAVMLVHGRNDSRVDVWNSAKAAARLQAANPGGKPVLLRLDANAGHGFGTTAKQTYAGLADVYDFFLWQFGKLPGAPVVAGTSGTTGAATAPGAKSAVN